MKIKCLYQLIMSIHWFEIQKKIPSKYNILIGFQGIILSLYYLRQAPRAWYDRFKKFLLENNFARENIDKTLFIKKKNNKLLVVQIYVDDIIFGTTNEVLCKEFTELILGEFEMSLMGELNYFIGI